jgi:hypothetical protein
VSLAVPRTDEALLLDGQGQRRPVVLFVAVEEEDKRVVLVLLEDEGVDAHREAAPLSVDRQECHFIAAPLRSSDVHNHCCTALMMTRTESQWILGGMATRCREEHLAPDNMDSAILSSTRAEMRRR